MDAICKLPRIAKLSLLGETMKIFRFDAKEITGEDQIRCWGCGFSTDALYVLASSREEAKKMILEGRAGLCGLCFAEMLATSDTEIIEA